MNRRRIAVVGAAVALFLLAGAHGGATGVIKERMDAMKAMKDAVKTLKPMVLDGAPLQAEIVIPAAERLVSLTGGLAARFPEGSLEPPTEALPAIWEDWRDFEGLARRAAAEAAKLRASAGASDEPAMRSAFLGLVETCRTCHDRFRAD